MHTNEIFVLYSTENANTRNHSQIDVHKHFCNQTLILLSATNCHRYVFEIFNVHAASWLSYLPVNPRSFLGYLDWSASFCWLSGWCESVLLYTYERVLTHVLLHGRCGLIFAVYAQPPSTILFSDYACITMHDQERYDHSPTQLTKVNNCTPRISSKIKNCTRVMDEL